MRRAALSSLLLFLTALTAGCVGADEPTDAGRTDAGGPRDAGPPDAADPPPVDAGPPAPSGEMALTWSTRITSQLRLGGAAESRLAPLPDDRFALSFTLSGAPALLAADTPQQREVGVGVTDASQIISIWQTDGTFVDARLVAIEDATMLDGFSALGYGLTAHADGSLVTSGRFVGGARFGVTDPLAISYATIREMPEDMIVVTSAEGYVARFDTTQQLAWARRGRSDSGFADHRFLDVAALADGGSLVTGSFSRTLTFGEPGFVDAVLDPTSAASTVETFFAKYDADGALEWTRRMAGDATPRRLATFADGSFVAVFRYNEAVVVGPGETNETTLPAPPAGTIAWDAVGRFEANGDLRWVKALGSDETTYPGLLMALTRDDGSVTVAGTFRGMLAWADETVDPLRINAVDGLIAQLDADGHLVWQTRITPVRDLSVQALAPTADGTGTWLAATVGQSGFNTFLPDDSVFELPGSLIDSRLMLLRYDDAGVLQAAQLLASTETDADELELLPDGDLLLVGRFGDGTVLEPGTTEERPLPTASAFRNVFMARYTAR